MALTQITTSGLANGAVTSSKISNTVQLGGPTISQIQITDSSYNVLDDTAVSTNGGYIKITGTGFAAGAIVVIGSVNATSTGFVSSTVLNVQVPALSAGTYTVYVVNSNGGTAIGVNGLTYSAEPNWVTGSTLPSGLNGTPISIQLDATSATTYTLQAGSTLPIGLTLTSGGLLSGTVTVGVETVYSFTVVATDAELQDSPRAFTITIIVGDPYFYLTTLLLPGNGTNNGTNNAFTDSSTNALAITRYGNTTQGTYSPFSQTGWSNYFDGTGDYLTVPLSSNLAFGTGDFTIECWINLNTVSVAQGIYSMIDNNSDPWEGVRIVANSSTFQLISYVGGAEQHTISHQTALQANTWYHVAATRSGTTIRIFLNGVVGNTTATSSTSYGQSGSTIGSAYPGAQPLNGYISNLRVIKGTAQYTSTFIPSVTPLTAISGTQLLTCQSNRFLDNSTNNFAISIGGDTSVTPFEPFAPGSSYSAGTVGGSSYYDGTADYLTVADNAGLDIGLSSTPFTLEFWVWFNNLSSSQTTYARGGGTGGWDGSAGWQWTNFYYSADGSFYNQFWNGSSRTDFAFNFNSAGGKPMQWNHIAYSYNGSNYSCFVNGTRAATITASFGKPSSSNKTCVGAATGVVSGETNVLNGYISGLRIVKGTAVYDPTLTTLTVPTAPPTAVANTSLLLNFSNGQILDSTSKNLLETVGDAKISTAESKWGGSSMYFDGTGDWLQIPYNEYYNIGSSNYTVEAWIKTTVTTGEIVSAFSSSSPFPGWLFGIGFNNNDGKLKFYNANGSSSESFTSTGTVNNNNWNHVAVTKSGTSLRFFINGTLDSTHTMTIVGTGSNQPILIGADNNPSKGRYYTGYINDLRITKGYARYTTNFTPPTSAFPTL